MQVAGDKENLNSVPFARPPQRKYRSGIQAIDVEAQAFTFTPCSCKIN